MLGGEVDEADRITPEPNFYHRHRFPAEIISRAVWLYHVFNLSLRDVALIPADRGVVVTQESIRNRCQTFGAEFAKRHGPSLLVGRHLACATGHIVNLCIRGCGSHIRALKHTPHLIWRSQHHKLLAGALVQKAVVDRLWWSLNRERLGRG